MIFIVDAISNYTTFCYLWQAIFHMDSDLTENRPYVIIVSIDIVDTIITIGIAREEVFYKGDQFIIQRAGKSMAVVISPSEYEAYRKQRKLDMKVFDEIRKRNDGAKLEEVDRDVQEAIGKSRL